MSVYRDGDVWRYRKVIRVEATRHRISGTPAVNTKAHAERAERDHIERLIAEATIARHAPESLVEKAAVPTFTEFFEGRYWTEYAIGEKENREGTRQEKRSIFDRYLKPALGHLSLDAIDIGAINRLRADLKTVIGRTGKPLSDKTRANILNVLSNVLKYALESDTIASSPRVKVKKPARPEIETWTFEEYGRALGAAFAMGKSWELAYLLAGDSGLRIGEILGADLEDCDLVAGVLTVARQVRRGVVGVPKGGKPRAVPLTARAVARIRELPQKSGRLVRLSEGDVKHGVYDLCQLAGLPARSWHCARHAFATHAALLGVNPLRLQRWLGHATLDMTLRYVHFVDDHPWPIPDIVLMAGADVLHPDRRITAQLGVRAAIAPEPACQSDDKEKRGSDKLSKPRLISVAGAGFEPVIAAIAKK